MGLFDMIIAGSQISESLLAPLLWALHRVMLVMHSHVDCVGAFVLELITATLAFVIFVLYLAFLLMSVQVTLRLEPTFTARLHAPKGLCQWVHFHVGVPLRKFVEELSTIFANIAITLISFIIRVVVVLVIPHCNWWIMHQWCRLSWYLILQQEIVWYITRQHRELLSTCSCLWVDNKLLVLLLFGFFHYKLKLARF